ncbi:MAG: hypothetical protein ACHQT8_06250 [Chlamydiales bacterium]
MKKGFNITCLLLLIGVGAFFFSRISVGFSLSEIVATTISDEAPFTPNPLLEQSFVYLGKGEQFYAFLGEDQATVLKFFRHKTSPSGKEGDLTTLLRSAELAYSRLREETGLIAIHLHKSHGLPKVTLVDAIGIRHTVDLNETEFLLQKRAEPFCMALDKKMRSGDLAGAKKQIRSLFASLRTQCAQGIHNSDTAFKRNFGVVGDQAVCIDIGSLWDDKRIKEKSGRDEEIRQITARLQRWLKKHYPELLQTFVDESNQKHEHKKRTAEHTWDTETKRVFIVNDYAQKTD